MKGLLSLLAFFCCLAVVANAQDVVINELIYDDDGTDDACWLEIKGPPNFPLNGYRLIGINGNGGGEYQQILLDGQVIPADGYFLINQTASMPNGDMVDVNVNYQNGDDSVQLQVQGEPPLPIWVVVDAVGYGAFIAGEVFAGEGTPAQDVTGSAVSLARCPDGNDTDNNGADFIADPNPTPGAMNMGDCYPPTGACCFTDGSCQELTADNCTAANGEYQGDGTLCDPNPCTPLEPTDYNCCELAEDNPATGRPLHEGEWIRVDGIVLQESWLWAANRTEFTITDESGCCINIYKGDQALSIVRGDEVEVVGTLAFFNGKTQVTTPNMTITVLSMGNPIPDPTPVETGEFAANGEAYESCLLKFTCVTITGGTWPAQGSDANITVDDGSGPTTLRIDRDTNIDGSQPPQGPFSAVGIGGQYDTTEPYFQGYQMNPRDVDDVLYFECWVWGACCYGDGSCEVTTEEDCTASGGISWTQGMDCDPNPCVPQYGACCFADYSCQETMENECYALGGEYWIAEGVCEPNPCAPIDYNCCDLAQDTETGQPVHLGQWIRVTGIALHESFNWATNRTEFTITDESGCCIDVYSVTPIGFDIFRGDEVEVIGTVAFYNGKTEISPPNLVVTVLSQGNPLPAPGEVTTGELASNGEAYESCLIKLTCVTITEGAWPPAGQDANLTVDDGTGPVTLRIDRDTDIDGSTPPPSEFSAIGIATQYDTSQPYFQGYQLMPRSLVDILYNDCLPPLGACCFADGNCMEYLEDECTQLGGDFWIEGGVCEPNPCPQPGACCYGCQECAFVNEADCMEIPEWYLWLPGENCEPNPCPPTATRTETWGRIKQEYK